MGATMEETQSLPKSLSKTKRGENALASSSLPPSILLTVPSIGSQSARELGNVTFEGQT